MGTVNEHGIYEYDLTDPGPGPELFNLQSAALTALESGRTSVLRVANTAARANAVTEHGPASASNPIIVFRANATPGRELEYTTNGTTWRTLAAEQDTGWVNANVWSSWSSAYTPGYRILNGVVYLRGEFWGGSSGTVLFNLPPSATPWSRSGFVVKRPTSLTHVAHVSIAANGQVSLAADFIPSGSPGYDLSSISYLKHS